jgi:hypothetical protein
MAGAAERNCWTGMGLGKGRNPLKANRLIEVGSVAPHQGRKAELGLLLNTPQIFTHAETGTALQTRRRARAEAPDASAARALKPRASLRRPPTWLHPSRLATQCLASVP